MNTQELTHHEHNSAETPGADGRRSETWPELKEHLVLVVGERAEFVGGSFFPLPIPGFKGFSVSDVDGEKDRAQVIVSYDTKDAKGRSITGHLTFRLFRDAGGVMQMTGDKISPSLGVSKEVLAANICQTLERLNPNLWLLFEHEAKEKVGDGGPRVPKGGEPHDPPPVDMRRIEFLQNQEGLECAISMAGLSEIESLEELDGPKKEAVLNAAKLSGYCYFIFPKGALWDSAICENAPYFFTFPEVLPEREIRGIMLEKELGLAERKSRVKAILERVGLLAEMRKSKPRLIAEGKRYAAKHPDSNADGSVRDLWYARLQEFITHTLR